MEKNLSEQASERAVLFEWLLPPVWIYQDPFGTEQIPEPGAIPYPEQREHSEFLGAAPTMPGAGPLE